jgi:chromosome segregation ATPase
MGRHTTGGEQADSHLESERPSRSRTWSRLFGLVVVSPALLTAIGCGATRPVIDLAKADQNAVRVQDLALRDARAEAAGLRTAVAAARIAAAKQDVELQNLRREIGELQQMLLAKQNDIATLRQEQMQLLQAKADIHAEVVEIHDGRAMAAETPASDAVTTSRLSRLESAMQALTASLEQLKKDLTKLQAHEATKPRPKPMTGNERSAGPR